MSTCLSNTVFWAMFGGQLILYPRVLTDVTLEIIGILSPSTYTEEDLNKSMVKEVSDSDTEVQGLSDLQLKLVRYRVLTRLAEDIGRFDVADRFEARANRLKHEMHESHSDSNFTDSTGRVRVEDV